MLHVTGVIISTVFFLHLLRLGHEKRDCIALIGLVMLGYLAFGMLHVTGVIISTVFFLHLSEWA